MIKIQILILCSLTVFVGCIPQIKEAARTPAPNIRVLLAQVSAKDSIIFNSTYEMKSEEAKYEFGRKNRRIYIEANESGYQIFNENRIFKLNKSDVLSFSGKSDDAIFTFKGKRFHGDILFTLKPGPGLSVINRLNLEIYLKGVVPSEMPSRNNAYADALKAQAICARTYALGKMNDRKTHPFDVYADHRDQVYGGLNAETQLASESVRQTRGDVLMYNDSLAAIFYHSTSGGLLESSQNVWSNINKPYLQSKQDAIGKEFASSISPYFRWADTLNLYQIDDIFSKKLNKSFLNQTVTDTTTLSFEAKIIDRTSGGRVSKMQVTYGDTTLTLEGHEIRQLFTSPKGGGLPSTLFSISSQADSVLIIKGGGFGHGVGMCQYGAMNMSQKGFKYYDILVNKYFDGTYLKKVY